VTEQGPAAGNSKTDLITGNVAPRERDIDVVLVTGAGASRAFGVNDAPMPLMADWADHLVRKLGQRMGYLEATGLRRGMSGEDFEGRLGKFLQDVEAFRRIGDLLDPSVKFQDFGPGTQIMMAQGVMEQWRTQAVHHYGRVGWFRRPDGSVYAANVVKHHAGFGVPVVMLPDPGKVYDQDDIIIAMWREFSEALARAKRVFVLGHSLNDQYLLRALVQNVQPLDRIAVSVLADEHDPAQPHESAGPVLAKISEVLGNAAIIPMRFGGNADAGLPGIRVWTEKLASNDWL